jgi:hypothetical protein
MEAQFIDAGLVLVAGQKRRVGAAVAVGHG